MMASGKATAKQGTTYARSQSCAYKFGAHVAMAGGISNAIENALKIGANSFALFLKSPRKWESPPISSTEIERFHKLCVQHGYDPLTDILPHGSYFINLGNPDIEKQAKSYNLFLDDLRRCEQLGIGMYNFHPGLSLNGNHADLLKQLASNINRAIADTKFVRIVLENMAGHGNLIGLLLEDLRDVIAMVDNKDRVGVCVDTCHAFAAGYDIRDQNSFDAFWKNFDEVIGPQYLSAIHLNDSKAPLGANRDLHQNIGRGFLGLVPFRLVANCVRLKNIPIILETPLEKDDTIYGDEIKLLEWLVGRPESDSEFISKNELLWLLGSSERADQEKKFAVKKRKAAKTNECKKETVKKGGIRLTLVQKRIEAFTVDSVVTRNPIATHPQRTESDSATKLSDIEVISDPSVDSHPSNDMKDSHELKFSVPQKRKATCLSTSRKLQNSNIM